MDKGKDSLQSLYLNLIPKKTEKESMWIPLLLLCNEQKQYAPTA